jgi:hypothetical protein
MVLVLVLAAAGCNQAKKIWDEQGPAAVTVSESLKKLASMDLPRLEKDGFTVAGPIKHVSEGGDMLVLFNDRLADLTARMPTDGTTHPAYWIGYEHDLESVFYWVRNREIPEGYGSSDNASTTREQLGTLTRVKQVLILKVIEQRVPSGGTSTFQAGSFLGEAHLVTLDGKHLGGVRFSGRNSATVTVKTTQYTTGGPKFTDTSALDRDLRASALKQLDMKLKKHLSSRLPHMFGYDEKDVVLD